MENENPHQKISFLLQLIDQVLEQHKGTITSSRGWLSMRSAESNRTAAIIVQCA